MATKVDEVSEVVDLEDVVVIGFFDDRESETAKAFLDAADQVDEAYFIITSEKVIRKEYDVGKGDKIVLFKKFDEGRVVYDGKIESEV